MKKTVIGMALMAMALVGFNGMAQNTTQSCKAQTENSCCKQGDKKGMKKEARGKMNPYEGLTLTEAQKGKLAELDAKQQAKRQAKMEARKADVQKGEAAKAEKKNMTDAEKQAAKQAKMQARKAEKLEYLQEVKEIIGPDQYVVFLENFYVNGGQQGGPKAMKQGQKGGKKSFAQGQNKGGKGSKKGGDRKGGQRGQKNAAAAQS